MNDTEPDGSLNGDNSTPDDPLNPTDLLQQFREKHRSLQKPERVYELGAQALAAQVNSEPISISDLAAEHSSSDSERVQLEKDIGYAKRQIAKKTDTHALPTDAEKFIHRYVQDLDLSESTEDDALRLLDTSHSTIAGRASPSVAAGLVYTAAFLNDEPITQTDMAETSNVSPVTIRKIHNSLLEEAEVAEA
ncbi:MAG: hypothetical protein ABEH81_00815 [Halopenitus sp.]